jgi:hypothetical protein
MGQKMLMKKVFPYPHSIHFAWCAGGCSFTQGGGGGRGVWELVTGVQQCSFLQRELHCMTQMLVDLKLTTLFYFILF